MRLNLIHTHALSQLLLRRNKLNINAILSHRNRPSLHHLLHLLHLLLISLRIPIHQLLTHPLQRRNNRPIPQPTLLRRLPRTRVIRNTKNIRDSEQRWLDLQQVARQLGQEPGEHGVLDVDVCLDDIGEEEEREGLDGWESDGGVGEGG